MTSYVDRYLTVKLVQEISDTHLGEMLRTLQPIGVSEELPDGGKEFRVILPEHRGWRDRDYTFRPRFGRKVRVAWENGASAMCPTFHTTSSHFNPSLAEVYGSIRAYVPDWRRAKFVWLDANVVEGRPMFWCNWTSVFMARALLFTTEFDENGQALP